MSLVIDVLINLYTCVVCRVQWICHLHINQSIFEVCTTDVSCVEFVLNLHVNNGSISIEIFNESQISRNGRRTLEA